MRGLISRTCALVAGLGLATSLAAQEGDDVNAAAVEDESVTCLSMNRVRTANAVNDRVVLFALSNGDMYLNQLDRDCPGLGLYNRFSYNLRTGARIPRLCHSDTLTVIEPTGDGFTCGLGRFEPVSAAALEALQRDPNEPEPEVTVIDIEADESIVAPAPTEASE